MNFIGIDLHKKTISVCVMNQERKVLRRPKFSCAEPDQIMAFFQQCRPFQAVVEATASYEWLWQLLEPLAQRLGLAHPKKLRVIAESKNKSDRLDAQVLAGVLALDISPAGYRPTPRPRQDPALGRHRAVSLPKAGGSLCRLGAGPSRVGRPQKGFKHHQGRLRVIALGVDPDRLANGALHGAVALCVRESQEASGVEAGHRGRGPPA